MRKAKARSNVGCRAFIDGDLLNAMTAIAEEHGPCALVVHGEARVGEWQPLHDFVNGGPQMVSIRWSNAGCRTDLRAVALRRSDRFDEKTGRAAEARLRSVGAAT